MGGGDNLSLSVTILLTGFAVVFAVLLILIGIIKLYGTVIYSIQNKKKSEKVKVAVERPVVETPAPAVVVEAPQAENDDELIAVITAAVYSMYGSSPVRVRSVRKAQTRGSSWRSAGLADNLRPF